MILIAGATGQLGRAVVKQLAKRVAAERIGVFVRDERTAADLKVAQSSAIVEAT